MSYALTQYLGDTTTHSIPMRWRGRPFVPGSAWTLVFTVKAFATDLDAARLLQKSFPGQGTTVSGHTASVEILRADTFRTLPDFEAAAGDYVWDIQAYQTASPNHTRTVASGSLTLVRDITRLSALTGPFYTTEDPALLVVGATGATGPAGTITDVTVATGAADTDAVVALGGTADARTIALTIPRGDTGAQGPAGPAGTNIRFQQSELPASPVDGDLWYDTSDASLSIWDDTAAAWVALVPASATAGIPDNAYVNAAGEYYVNAAGEYYTATV